MNPLHAELQRLYLPHNLQPDALDLTHAQCPLINASGRVRAMVVQVSQLAGWNSVATLWHGIQDELGLPSAAIAVSGIDSYQVWFSLQEPVTLAQATDFLQAVQRRYLGEVASQHMVMMPMVDTAAPGQTRHARLVPALQAETGHWSAFIAPGLISMFAEEPWLELPPSSEAQAKLLSNVQSIQPAQFRQAQEQLKPTRTTAAAPDPNPAASVHADADPKRFLLAVMNDPSIELGLRIEAAKALLPYGETPCQR